MSGKVKINQILGALLIIIGSALIPTGLSKGVTMEVAATFASTVLIVGGLIVLAIRKMVVVQKAVPELQTNRQIVIWVNDDGGVKVEAWDLDLHNSVAILEISKHQIISQFTGGGKNPMEIIRRK